MKVWYVSYGSNMNYNRFLTYIQGGKVIGSNKTEVGCKNKELPLRHELFLMNRKIRFLEHSKRWDGSGLFLGEEGNHSNYAVRYLIEDDQFIEILKQENNQDLDVKIDLTRKDLENNITKVVFPHSWYSTLLFMGEYDGFKAYTFTCDKEMFSLTAQKPSDRYLKVVINGVNQFNIVSTHDIVQTFLETDGVKEFYQYDDILNLIEESSKTRS